MVAVEGPKSQSLLGQRLAVCHSVNIVVQQLQKEQRIKYTARRVEQVASKLPSKLLSFAAVLGDAWQTNPGGLA